MPTLRQRTRVGVVVLLLSVTACGSGSDRDRDRVPGAFVTPSSDETAVRDLADAALTDLLLDRGALPEGYTVDRTPQPARVAAGARTFCEQYLGDPVDLVAAGADQAVRIDFEAFVETEVNVRHAVVRMPSTSAAKDRLEELRSSVRGCTSFTKVVNGRPIDGRVVKLGLLGLGADGIAVNATFSFGAQRLGLDLAVGRAGPYLSAVAVGGGATVDHKVTERLAALALRDLTAAAVVR